MVNEIFSERKEYRTYQGTAKLFAKCFEGIIENDGKIVFSLKTPFFDDEKYTDFNSFFDECKALIFSFLQKKKGGEKVQYAFLDFDYKEKAIVFSFSFSDFEHRNKKKHLKIYFDDGMNFIKLGKKRIVDKNEKSPYT